jgi:hypothetical protein
LLGPTCSLPILLLRTTRDRNLASGATCLVSCGSVAVAGSAWHLCNVLSVCNTHPLAILCLGKCGYVCCWCGCPLTFFPHVCIPLRAVCSKGTQRCTRGDEEHKVCNMQGNLTRTRHLPYALLCAPLCACVLVCLCDHLPHALVLSHAQHRPLPPALIPPLATHHTQPTPHTQYSHNTAHAAPSMQSPHSAHYLSTLSRLRMLSTWPTPHSAPQPTPLYQHTQHP